MITIINKIGKYIVCEIDADNLINADLRKKNLIEAYFRDMDLSGSDFEGSNLESANFVNAKLEGANFKNAFLLDANMENANIKGANFEGATITGLYLNKSNLEEANFIGARLSNDFVITKNPVQVDREDFYVIIFGDYMQIGCYLYKADDWWKFSDKDIIKLNGKKAFKVWKNEGKEYLQNLYDELEKEGG